MSPRGKYSEIRTRAVAAGIAAGLVSAMAILTLSHTPAEARKAMFDAPSQPSAVVARIAASATINPAKARSEMFGVYRRDALTTGADYRTAAKLFEKSDDKKDLLLAHDLAVAGMALGDGASRAVVARTEDRLFQAAGFGERYGTLGGKALPLSESHRRLMQDGTTLGYRQVALRLVPVTAG
jgi:hypothetical protein